jgi:dihydroorotate dehydrogenase (NAD+) catalytic subunit
MARADSAANLRSRRSDVRVGAGQPRRHATIREVAPPNAVDLSVSIGALRLANPVIAASGTFGYGVEFAHLVDLNKLGGIVVKGLSLEPMAGAPAPRLCEVRGGMLNAIGLQNIGVRAFVAEKLPLLRAYRTPIIANVFGHSLDEYLGVLRALEEAEGVSAYELNVSCPNVSSGGMEFGADSALVSQLVEAARHVARRPLWVKLSPLVTDIAAIARAAEQAGADALTVANTYPAMAVDSQTGRSRLGRPTGGLSGPAIKPITLRQVYQVCRAVSIPVIGLGGIELAEDVLEYMVVGATAVQVGTASFADPKACERLVEELDKLCKSRKILSISKIRASLDDVSN